MALLSGVVLLYYPFGNQVWLVLVSALMSYTAMLVAPKYAGRASWFIAFPILLIWCALPATAPGSRLLCQLMQRDRGTCKLVEPCVLKHGKCNVVLYMCTMSQWQPGWPCHVSSVDPALLAPACGKATERPAMSNNAHVDVPL